MRCAAALHARKRCAPCASRSAIADRTTKASTSMAAAASACGASASSTSHRPSADFQRRRHRVDRLQRRDLQLPGIARGLDRAGHHVPHQQRHRNLVHLYEEEGVEGMHQLRGMFAFAIWDDGSGNVLLARDRFGKKPLYYADLPGRPVLRERVEMPARRRRSARARSGGAAALLPVHLHSRSVVTPLSRTCANCRRAPGCVSHADGRVEQGRYWRCPVPAEEGPPGSSEADASRAIARAVRRIRAHPHDRRCSAGRVPERRHRFEPGCRVHGAAIAASP